MGGVPTNNEENGEMHENNEQMNHDDQNQQENEGYGQ